MYKSMQYMAVTSRNNIVGGGGYWQYMQYGPGWEKYSIFYSFSSKSSFEARNCEMSDCKRNLSRRVLLGLLGLLVDISCFSRVFLGC